VITPSDIRRLVPMRDAIEAVRSGFIAKSKDMVDQPRRQTLLDGTLLSMMARPLDSDSACVKVVSIGRADELGSSPRLHAVLLWFDSRTGRATGLVEATELTALRTGAATGLATELLSASNATQLAVFGAGAQAPDQIRGVCSVREIAEVRLYSRSAEHCLQLAVLMRTEMPDVRFVISPDASFALEGADIVCTATTATKPLFDSKFLKERVHINAIGAYRADMCELPQDVFAGATQVVVDDLTAALHEAGDIIHALEGHAISEDRLYEIGALAAERPREFAGWTVFKSVGIAIQDWSVARLLMERATGDGATHISL
jgi:ornithine cyclodeaminase/alanine dehydrogenase-like protein (mu-crystallin family)